MIVLAQLSFPNNTSQILLRNGGEEAHFVERLLGMSKVLEISILVLKFMEQPSPQSQSYFLWTFTDGLQNSK